MGDFAQDAGAALWEERAATAAAVADEAFDESRGQDAVLFIDSETAVGDSAQTAGAAL